MRNSIEIRLPLTHAPPFSPCQLTLRSLCSLPCCAIHEPTQVTRDKVVVVSGTDDQRQEVLLGHLSAEALEGGRLGCPGAPAFNAELYLAGGDAGGLSTSEESSQPS